MGPYVSKKTSYFSGGLTDAVRCDMDISLHGFGFDCRYNYTVKYKEFRHKKTDKFTNCCIGL